MGSLDLSEMTAPPGPTAQQRPLSRYEPSREVRRASGRRRSQGLGGVLHQERELRELLRRRLLVFVICVVALYGLIPITSLPLLWSDGVSDAVRWTTALQWVSAALVGVVGLLIARKPAKSLRTLRAFEIAAFAIAVGYIALLNVMIARTWGLATPPIGEMGHSLVSPSGMRLDPLTLRWFVMVVAYGTLIPNTWRRTAVVIGIMNLVFLASVVGLGVAGGVPAREFPALLLYPVVWMLVASVTSIFGSYRVSVLERRVYDAQRLGQYKLIKRLGTGGMGEVFLAEHIELKQPFAIKMLHPDRVTDPRALQRFEREVRAMAQLEHWNTVEVYDFGHAPDGAFYYVMEYLPGYNLDELVQRHGPMAPGRAIYILRQVCAALQEAHARGLLHRDIKPANIIVSERAGLYDVAKLADFGLVKSLDGDSTQSMTLTQEGTVQGTPAFMSPEQVLGKQDVDARSDIYSLGAVLYHLLTGRPPFQRDTTMKTLAAQLYEDPVPPQRVRAGLDPMLDALVLRCLEKAPDVRYPDIAALDRALAECQKSAPWTQRDAEAWWSALGAPAP